MDKFEILCLLKAISNYAYDIHYSAQGKFFYSDHLFSERLADVDIEDDFIETLYLGESEDAPSSVEINSKVVEITPEIHEEADKNFKTLRDMIVVALVEIERYKTKTRAEEDILGSIAHVLQRHNGLLFRQLKYSDSELKNNKLVERLDDPDFITVHGNPIPVPHRATGEEKDKAVKEFLKEKEDEAIVDKHEEEKQQKTKEEKIKDIESRISSLTSKYEAIDKQEHSASAKKELQKIKESLEYNKKKLKELKD